MAPGRPAAPAGAAAAPACPAAAAAAAPAASTGAARASAPVHRGHGRRRAAAAAAAAAAGERAELLWGLALGDTSPGAWTTRSRSWRPGTTRSPAVRTHGPARQKLGGETKGDWV